MAETKRLKRPFTRRKQLEQDLAHVSEEMYKRNFELAQTNKILSLVRTIDTLVLGSQKTLEEVCQQIAGTILDDSAFTLVAIFALPLHKTDLSLVGCKLPETVKLNVLEDVTRMQLDGDSSWLRSRQADGILQVADFSDKKLSNYLNISVETAASLRAAIATESVYYVKLLARQRVVGVMAVGLNKLTHKLSAGDEALLGRVSEAVGIALDNRLLYEENQLVLEQLRKTNQKLKSLDETKDEFISMASHQLRTPLTSVKGYLSMVLEGDAGKVGEKQRPLLDQAFQSSQRMVNLIADLLNVSRIHTGKFVIESKATNLAEVIEGEINQLTQSAKAHNLELSYSKPKDFPMLMLDETKIRQVIMNFVDNAIYYTPSGGHIKVSLEDKGQSIEFTVADDGLGVPKADQHHLFTKFYRAGNARKARPDGTGLGLFMAKKVVVAQGGALIFHSEEGKGSTFGFTFPKQKLQAGLSK